MTSERFEVSEAEADLRLDLLLASRYPEQTRSALGRLIRAGHALLDGMPSKAGRRVRSGEVIELSWPADNGRPSPSPEDIPLDILHEDADMLVISKQAGLVVHPAVGHRSGTLVNAVAARYGALPERGDAARAGVVHRLDRDTSGCIVMARTERALVRLQRQFQGRRVKKTYLAIVLGQPDLAAGSIEYAIERSRRDHTRMQVVREGGRPATTGWLVVERLPGSTLLELDLKTGRTHQIRVHLEEYGLPVVGDATYGKGRRARGVTAQVAQLLQGFPRQALHASRLELEHPESGEAMVFEAPLPQDMLDLLEALRGAARAGL